MFSMYLSVAQLCHLAIGPPIRCTLTLIHREQDNDHVTWPKHVARKNQKNQVNHTSQNVESLYIASL